MKSAILSGRLNPAERLTEEHRAEMMGVSRTPVREALYELESQGFIKPLEKRGFIASLDSENDVRPNQPGQRGCPPDPYRTSQRIERRCARGKAY